MSMESIVASYGLALGWGLFLALSAGPLLLARTTSRLVHRYTPRARRATILFVYTATYFAAVIGAMSAIQLGIMVLIMFPVWAALYIVGFETLSDYVHEHAIKVGAHAQPLAIAGQFKLVLIGAIAYGSIMASFFFFGA